MDIQNLPKHLQQDIPSFDEVCRRDPLSNDTSFFYMNRRIHCRGKNIAVQSGWPTVEELKEIVDYIVKGGTLPSSLTQRSLTSKQEEAYQSTYRRWKEFLSKNTYPIKKFKV